MPPKARIPAPIDRPLSRAYLREFTGWSTAYPPGVSDSTSQRLMDNMLVLRDGSIRIRPGLRYLSYTKPPTEAVPVGTGLTLAVVGTHEPFFLNDGTKAWLFAVRESDDTVGFRVLLNFDDEGQKVVRLTDPQAGFSVPQGLATLNFSAATTYVKYLQIDNKIMALSDAGEMLRLFTVGGSKTAKRLLPVTRPTFTVTDKLSVVLPDAAWVNTGAPGLVRTNRVTNPSFESNTDGWAAGADTGIYRTTGQARVGTYSMRLTSLALRTNLMPRPLNNPASTGFAGWTVSPSGTGPTLDPAKNAMRFFVDVGPVDKRAYAYGPSMPVTGGKVYAVAHDTPDLTNVKRLGIITRFYNANNVQVGADAYHAEPLTEVRHEVRGIKPPTGATQMRVFFYIDRSLTTGPCGVSIDNVMVCLETESTAMFTGGSGANYFWTGTANASSSVYHPPQDVSARTSISATAGTYTSQAFVRSTTIRQAQVDMVYIGTDGDKATVTGTPTATQLFDWNRVVNISTAPAGTANANMWVAIPGCARGEYHYVDCVLSERAAAVDSYFDGDTTDLPESRHAWTGTADNSTSTERQYSVASSVPTPETRTASTLINSTPGSNAYNFGFFYTIANELGETAGSQVTVVRTQRAWSSWRWETPNAAGEPSGTETNDPERCCDQLVAVLLDDVFNAAIAAGAVSWNLYMYTWSDQDPVPVTAVRVATRSLTKDSTLGSQSWLRVTPQQAGAGAEILPIPSAGNRYNATDPSRGGQGIVAADRMILVKDPTQAGTIKWSSNQQGSYSDFSASRGGGFKTLTSGNLYITACVKLWQNPQSVDTLTILNKGVDGVNNSYYMAPAQIAQQSEAVNVMGFEETTATPGTVSPFGCEVFNNAMYHPLDDQLMKSTANNYNINHKSQTDKIENMWKQLTRKEWIISSQLDGRIYYLVHNRFGAPLEDGANGNEVWVFDAASEKGNWSRWTVQGVSLRKVEQIGRVHMSIVKPDGIYYFDELYGVDDFVDAGNLVQTRSIPWSMETNTQGANKAHDSWAHLQQCNVIVGNFYGSMRYGIRSYDLHGKPVEVAKELHQREWGDPGKEMFDLEDFMLIRRDLKEWFFFAESLTKDDVVVESHGQLNSVQYRYTPVSVNVGYEYGSIETFEYGRSTDAGFAGPVDVYSTNGVPRPYVDVRQP